MIEFRNLTKYYAFNNSRKYIVNNVSLKIPTGSNIGILGPNGAGKSTLLRMIGGAESPNSGSVVTDEKISWPLGLATGFQGSLTGRQNVDFVCQINGLSKAETASVIESITSFAELGGYFEMPVMTYSSGMRARLTFGLSMAFRFDVYLIDELTSVGDMNFRNKAKKAFKDLHKRASVIFVSHNMKTLKRSCDSALLLREGEATFFPDISDGIDAYTEYVESNGGDGMKKNRSPQQKAKKKAKRKLKRKSRRLARKQARQNEIENPKDTTEGKV